jgi:C4-dicarboxylate-specific signal transduction histidine kinase
VQEFVFVNGLAKPLRGWSLGRKVSALLLVSSALPLVLVTTVVLERERSLVRAANVDLLQARVDQVSDTLEALLRGFHAAAESSAKDPTITEYCAAPPEARRLAEAPVAAHLAIFRGRDPAIRGVGVVDRAGQVLAATEPAIVGKSVAYRAYFRRALRGLSDTSEVYVSLPETDQVPTIALAEPVRSATGEVHGIMVVWLRAEALWSVMRAANGTAGQGSYFILFDRFGIRVGHSLSERLLFHPSTPLRPDDARALLDDRRFGGRTAELLQAVVPYPILEMEGAERRVFRRPRSPANQVDNIAVARRLPETGWTLVAHVPEEEVEVGLWTVLPRVLPAFLVGSLLAALGAFAILRQVVRPVRSLVIAAAALERGELDHEVGPPAEDAPPGDDLARLTEAFRSMARTIADRERSVRASNRDLRLVLDNVGQGFLAMDGAGAVSQERSATIDTWFGAPRTGETIWSYLGRVDQVYAHRLDQAWRAAGDGPRELAGALARLPPSLLRDASAFELEFRVVEAQGRIERVVLVVTDVSEELTRKRHELELEAELRQAQKLESVGRLASGIAHEINTPLQFVTDSCTFLDDAVEEVGRLVGTYRAALAEGATPARRVSDEALAEVARAEEEADLAYLLENMPMAAARALEGLQRVTSIVRAMKEFAHPDQKEMSLVDLNHAIESTLTIARNEYKYVAEARTELGPLPAVTCHPGEVNQVILNLIVNAAHAIGDTVRGTERRGTITIRTWVEGRSAVVAIGDTGGGIPEAIRHRVFDPFFTTKEVGRGTGQGLWIARSVVCEKHGGELTFETEAGRGTTFFIRLPIEGKRATAGAVAARGDA